MWLIPWVLISSSFSWFILMSPYSALTGLCPDRETCLHFVLTLPFSVQMVKSQNVLTHTHWHFRGVCSLSEWMMPHFGETLGHSLSCLSPLSFLFSVFEKDRTLLIRVFTSALRLCGMNERLSLSTPLWPALSGRCSACVFPSWLLAKHRHHAFLCGFWWTFFSSRPRFCASSQVTS